MPTPKQRAFAALVVGGSSLTSAYRQTYRTGGMSSTTVAKEASRLARNPHVAPLIEEGVRIAMEQAEWCRAVAVRRLEEVNRHCFNAIVGTDGMPDKAALYGFIESADRLNGLTCVDVETSDEREKYMRNPERVKAKRDQERAAFDAEMGF